MDVAADRVTDRGEIRRENGSLLSLAVARPSRLERVAAHQTGSGTQRANGAKLESQEVAGTKNSTAQQGGVIVPNDELVLSERPCRASTQSSGGQTPVLHYIFN